MGILWLINLFMAVVTHTREQTQEHLGTQRADSLHQESWNQKTDVALFFFTVGEPNKDILQEAISPALFSHDKSVLDISARLPLSQLTKCQRYLWDTVIWMLAGLRDGWQVVTNKVTGKISGTHEV